MSDKEKETEQTWLGTPLSDMYKGQGPWCFNIVPITPSKNYHVLYELPVNLKEPPRPHYNAQPKHWDDDYVRMPYSAHSLYVVKNGDEETVRPRWEVIKEALSKHINSIEELENAILSYSSKLPKFTALYRFFNEVLDEEESQQFFTHLLPKIIQLVLQLPELIPGSIPLLKKNHLKSISLSQLQVASLLANAFFCTFIWRKDMAGTYPGINFIKLFTADNRVIRQSSVSEKLKSIFHYFRRVTTKSPVGVISFERKYISKHNMPRWDVVDNNLGNTKIHITSTGTIEEGHGLLQVDFANKFVGGGVLGYGCVQEEIRFVLCPELIISRLFTEELSDCDALVVTGVERYSRYSGYGDTFNWDGNFDDETPYDVYGRRKTTICVIDATRFLKTKDQFHGSTILRELNKAYVGFSSKEKQNLSPVATGNWGCGAFRGDPNLKSLIQLMACSAAGRDLVYYSFGNTELRDDFYKMHLFLANNKITISQLWKYLCRFCAANVQQDKLYSFVQQCHFDMKSQPTLKQFLFFNTQKRKTENNLPSTSTNEDETKTKKTSLDTSFKRDEVEVSNKVIPQNKQETKKLAPKVYPTLPITLEQKNTKTSVKSDEVIHIINMIDGNPQSKSTKNEEEAERDNGLSLLFEVDKIKKTTINVKKEESTEIPMEVDDVEESPKTLSFIEDKKKKITDYFSKVTNHVNSYL